MDEILTRCGYHCDLCLAYRPIVEANPSNQQTLSDGWHKYSGFRSPAQQIMCDGCMRGDPQVIDQACPVRPCVIERALQDCVQCSEYGCERLVVYEDLAARIGCPIPEEGRARFIAPYENKRRLDRLRAKGH